MSFYFHLIGPLGQFGLVTTVLQEGLYCMGCPDILRSVTGCGIPLLSKAGRLVQQCLKDVSKVSSTSDHH